MRNSIFLIAIGTCFLFFSCGESVKNQSHTPSQDHTTSEPKKTTVPSPDQEEVPALQQTKTPPPPPPQSEAIRRKVSAIGGRKGDSCSPLILKRNGRRAKSLLPDSKTNSPTVQLIW